MATKTKSKSNVKKSNLAKCKICLEMKPRTFAPHTDVSTNPTTIICRDCATYKCIECKVQKAKSQISVIIDEKAKTVLCTNCDPATATSTAQEAEKVIEKIDELSEQRSCLQCSKVFDDQKSMDEHNHEKRIFSPGVFDVYPKDLDIWHYQIRSEDEFYKSITKEFKLSLLEHGGNYNLVKADCQGRVFAGARRTQGSEEASLKVKVQFIDITENDAWLMALADNTNRKNLSFLSIVKAIKKLHELKIFKKEIADKLGKRRLTISGIIEAIKMTDVGHTSINDLIKKGIKESHLEELQTIKDHPRIYSDFAAIIVNHKNNEDKRVSIKRLRILLQLQKSIIDLPKEFEKLKYSYLEHSSIPLSYDSYPVNFELFKDKIIDIFKTAIYDFVDTDYLFDIYAKEKVIFNETCSKGKLLEAAKFIQVLAKKEHPLKQLRQDLLKNLSNISTIWDTDQVSETDTLKFDIKAASKLKRLQTLSKDVKELIDKINAANKERLSKTKLVQEEETDQIIGLHQAADSAASEIIDLGEKPEAELRVINAPQEEALDQIKKQFKPKTGPRCNFEDTCPNCGITLNCNIRDNLNGHVDHTYYCYNCKESINMEVLPKKTDIQTTLPGVSATTASKKSPSLVSDKTSISPGEGDPISKIRVEGDSSYVTIYNGTRNIMIKTKEVPYLITLLLNNCKILPSDLKQLDEILQNKRGDNYN